MGHPPPSSLNFMFKNSNILAVVTSQNHKPHPRTNHPTHIITTTPLPPPITPPNPTTTTHSTPPNLTTTTNQHHNPLIPSPPTPLPPHPNGPSTPPRPTTTLVTFLIGNVHYFLPSGSSLSNVL